MKKIALLFVCLALANCIWAQLPNGSYAPEFSIYEIDKATGQMITDHAYTLSEYTNAGKAVYLDFFSTWCQPCWNYHQTGAFESLYNQYGPNGTNEVMVFGIEASFGNYASLSGTGSGNLGQSSKGNWLEGVLYPMIPLDVSPNTHSIKDDYQISFYPTICLVCPNRTVYALDTDPVADLYAAKTQYCGQYEMANNAQVVQLTGIDNVMYCDATFTPAVKIKNVGMSAMTSLKLKINYDGQESTTDWTGSVESFHDTDITLSQINETTNGNHHYTVTILKVNGEDDIELTQNTMTVNFTVNIDGETAVNEDFTTNNYTETWYCTNNLVEWSQQKHAILFNCFNLSQGKNDNLYLPLLNLNGYTNPTLQFDVAYACFDSYSVDTLEVYISTNCGDSWVNIYKKIGPELATTANHASYFTPTQDSQWRTETIDLTEYKGDQVLVKFVFSSGWGNVIWVDNVKAIEEEDSGDSDGIDEQNKEFSVYPNPASSILFIQSNTEIEKVEIFNMQGQLVGTTNGNVQNINIEDLNSGSYIIRVSTPEGVVNQMFVKE